MSDLRIAVFQSKNHFVREFCISSDKKRCKYLPRTGDCITQL